MGFQDRDYNRYEPYDDNGYRRPTKARGPMSMTMRIVILNVLLWLLNGLFFPKTHELTNLLLLNAANLFRPALWWEFLTYGFVHSPFSPSHILWNMIALIMFGYGMMIGVGGPGGIGLFRGESVETRLGRMEFLAFYLLTIIVGGVVYAIVNIGEPALVLGASGGVAGVVLLYALFFPNKILLFMMIIPMPMWMIGALMVFMDAYGAAGYGCQGVAFTVHLGGAGFALFYYYFLYRNRLRITDLFSGLGKLFKRKPKLKVYSEDDRRDEKPKREAKSGKDVEFEKRLDEILDRYGKVGEAGLTKEEREFLQRASKRYREKN